MPITMTEVNFAKDFSLSEFWKDVFRDGKG